MEEACWAQPIACEDRLYFFGKSGVTKIIKAGAEYELLVENQLWDAKSPPLPANFKNYEATESPATKSATETADGNSLDPVVYGVAAVDTAFFVRLGSHLFRIGGTPDSVLSVQP